MTGYKTGTSILGLPGVWFGIMGLLEDTKRRESAQLCAIGIALNGGTVEMLRQMLVEHGCKDAEIRKGDGVDYWAPEPPADLAEIYSKKASASLKKKVLDFVKHFDQEILDRLKEEEKASQEAKMNSANFENLKGVKILFESISNSASEAKQRLDKRFVHHKANLKREIRRIYANA